MALILKLNTTSFEKYFGKMTAEELDESIALALSDMNAHIEDDSIHFEIDSFTGLHRGWEAEPISVTANRDDAAQLTIQSDYLPGQKNINYSLTQLVYWSFGTFKGIGSGSTMAAADWTALDGALFLISAQQGSWFNLKNNGTAADNSKKILTGLNGDLKRIDKALLSYDATVGAWLLLAYSRINWQARYAFDTGATSETDIEIELPSSSGFPFDGYYHVSVFAEVSELDAGSSPINTAVAQTLSVSNMDDSDEFLLAISPVHAEPPSVPHKMINTSLNGSCILKIDGAACASRRAVVKIHLNGATNEAEGWLHAHYLGAELGANCYV